MSDDSKMSPGPWRVGGLLTDDPVYVIDTDGKTIATTRPEYVRAIAAVPRMIELLRKYLEDGCRCVEWVQGECEFCQATRALLRELGELP